MSLINFNNIIKNSNVFIDLINKLILASTFLFILNGCDSQSATLSKDVNNSKLKSEISANQTNNVLMQENTAKQDDNLTVQTDEEQQINIVESTPLNLVKSIKGYGF